MKKVARKLAKSRETRRKRKKEKTKKNKKKKETWPQRKGGIKEVRSRRRIESGE